MKYKFKIDKNNIDQVQANYAAILFGEHEAYGDKHKFKNERDVYLSMLEYILGSDDRAEAFAGKMSFGEIKGKYLHYEFDIHRVFLRFDGKEPWYSRKEGKNSIPVGILFRRRDDENKRNLSSKIAEINAAKA